MKSHKPMRKIFSSAITAIAAAAIALSLTACTYPFGKAALEFKTTETGADVPQISGLLKEEEVNNKLLDIFTPYANQAQEAVENSDGSLSIVYDMTESENFGKFSPEYIISMRISDGTYGIDIASATVSGFSDVTSSEPEETSWLSSADMIMSVIDLNRMGIDVDFSESDGDADEKFMSDFFVDLYEAFADKELDVSDITVGDSLGDDYKKELKLGLIPCYIDENSYEYSPNMDTLMTLNLSSVLTEDIERDVYGRQSESVTGQEFAELLRTLYNVCIVDEAEESEASWKDLGEVDFDAVIEDAELLDVELSRRDCAEILVRITQESPNYGIKYNDNNLIDVDDSESIWVRRAMTYNFMEYYGESTLFAPDENLTVVNAIETAGIYLNTRYSNWANFVENSDQAYSKYDAIIAAGRIADYFLQRPDEERNSFEVINVINDRDYDWFYSQQGTGEYSSVNCMPSIATMAAHWYNSQSNATVEDMRNTSDLTGGWSAFELRNGLESYDVPYDIVDANMDNILEALDNGKIILAQYSDRPSWQSGHCYVIYGYRKFNNSVTFIINDSDSLSNRAEIFGRHKGNGDELEGNFAMWTISRFVFDVTVVG